MKLGQFAPDQPDTNNADLEDCKNLIPVSGGYTGLPEPQSLTANTTDAEPLFLASMKAPSGTVSVWTGDASKLYALDKTSMEWQDASKVGGYSTGEETWAATKFGSRFICTNFNDNPQYIDAGSGTTFADLTNLFKCRQLATVGYFVFAGDTYDGTDGNVPNRVRWSGFNDSSDWTPSQTTQSDWQDLPSGGRVKRILGGDYAVIMQENSFHVAQYTADKFIFRFEEVQPGLGVLSGGSVVQVGRSAFYLGEDHFYIWDGGRSEPISDGRVSRWFFNDADSGNLHRITASVVPERNAIMWTYPRKSGGWGQIIYAWREDRWSRADATISVLGRTYSTGTTLEGLSVYGSLENVPASLDSRTWKGGQPVWAGMCPAGCLRAFTGTPLAWTAETGALQLAQGQRRTVVRQVMPESDCDTLSVQVGCQERPNDASKWSDTKGVEADGRAKFRQAGRYHRFRLSGSGDFASLTGFDVVASELGER